jgi:hypothetical protein
MTVTMFDAINLNAIPADAEAVAGYVNGKWPTYAGVVNRWPHAEHLSIAVTSQADADCLDVEKGDAPNSLAAGWVKRQIARGLEKPAIYTSVSNVRPLLGLLAHAGIKRSDIRLWTAHYTFHEHLCSGVCGFGMPTVADATQWTDKANSRSLDQSICSDAFFGTPPVPSPSRPGHRTSPMSEPEALWREWAYGEGQFAKYDAFEGPRPKVRKDIPQAWWVRSTRFLLARTHKEPGSGV